MKTIASVSLCMILISHTASAVSIVELKDSKDKLSYAVGVNLAKNLKEQKIELNMDAVIAGIKDVQTGEKIAMTEDEMRQAATEFQTENMKRLEAEKKELAQKNQTDGIRFLEENKKKKDVVTLPSGLQYRVTKAGAGAHPKAGSMVNVHYVGKLWDGTEFDSSRKRGMPAKLSLVGVIPGWTEGLQLMQPGAQWEFVIPANLAYGEQGAGSTIPPNATLIFDVELLSIDKPAPKAKLKPHSKIKS